MKMKLFKYGYLIRHAFDLGRIFPILIKQRGVSRFIVGISSEIIDAPTILLTNINSLNNKVAILWTGLIISM